MSRLEELIQKLCPNGVVYETLEKLIIKAPKSPYGVGYLSQMEAGDVICFTSGSKIFYVDEFLVDGEYIFMNDGGQADTKYFCGKSCYSDHVFAFTSEIINVKYLYHYLLQINDLINSEYFRGGGIKNLVKKDFLKIKIPMPPKEVQREIVQILDKFTLLTAELTAELTARKQQYEHYRDSLLSFNSEIKNLPLNDIMISIKDGSHNPPKDAGYATNLPMISAQNINNGIIDFTNVRFLTDSDFILEHKRTNIQRNDVLLTIVGAVGRVAVVNTDKKFTCQRSVCILKPNCELIDSEYLKFILESSNIQNYFINNANGAAQKGIYLNQIKNIMIPVPSLEIQKRLVKVLNNFDKICSDLGIGLPAEIEARQQQYEYYRSKLLTMVAEVVNFKASKQAS
ncbi:MAG: restriction endonuclease subunit S [Staphylococcus sp.]|nr:restriction endonuclease subunit S [Staphylococcus sp.]